MSPTVEISTALVTVKLEANEVSLEAMGKQALGLIADVAATLPPRISAGFGGHIERRGTWDAHGQINTGGAR